MHSLFILGNGFDLHHGLPTRYTDFMAFMKQRHSKVAGDFIKGIGLYSLHYWNRMDQITEDILWNDMESIFGSYETMEMAEEHRDWDSSPDYRGPAAKQLRDILRLPNHISDYLNKWLAGVEPFLKTVLPKPRLQALFSAPGSLYLNFNYTTTLESVYGLEPVYHLHGRVGETLVMGHGQILGRVQMDPREYGINVVNEKFVESSFRASRKNCKKIMKRLPQVFEPGNLEEVSQIFILGHSLNEIDMPYFRRIKRLCSKDVQWNIFVLPGQEDQYLERMRHLPARKEKVTLMQW